MTRLGKLLPYAQVSNLVDIEKSQIGFIADFARDWIPHDSDRQEFLEIRK